MNRSNSENMGTASLICGGFILILGLSITVYTFSQHSDWISVDAYFYNRNCHEVSERVSTGRGGSTSSTKTRCDVDISYNYNGQSYSHTEYNKPEHTSSSGKLMIDPNHPEIYADDSNTYIYLVICIVASIFCFYLSNRYEHPHT